ncbi:SMODS domain-containing nucleotidyltransferase [Chryseobacterium gambrini]|uniref:SMODS domain-containing nucleotidyltransferase n=1 Tax=Chryseobacterium gambrini TaxID=373672 RepID=UPI0022F3D188|nr:nucleotidyltransferase domain-containing protein [Chryseobacterium gambrini]WBX96038.1 nucleotidyltransferase domain-containing protein [Chryseobacterium gambrini]
MAVTINNYLRELSSNYYLKNDSGELLKINTSIVNLFKNLDTDLGLLINRRFVFGSFDRDTILPRKYDSESDVDIMVVFNHTDYERTPGTYRAWLKNFADKYYKNRYGSEVLNDFPTVTIKLNNIKYDLVPAKEEIYLYSKNTLYIPSSYNRDGWQITAPSDVKDELVRVNKDYNYIVKPVIRLLKAWNCKMGYPFDSYSLELQITKMNFFNDNIEKGFIWAAKMLSIPSYSAQWKKDKVNHLSTTIYKIEKYLGDNDLVNAKIELHKLLPY